MVMGGGAGRRGAPEGDGDEYRGRPGGRDGRGKRFRRGRRAGGAPGAPGAPGASAPPRGEPRADTAASEAPAEGRVVSRTRRSFRVRLDDGSLCEASLRGRMQDEERQPVVGDRVRVRAHGDGEGAIESILPRRNALGRVSEDDASKVRIMAANIDRLVAVLAVQPFPPRWALADRLLALCDREGYEGLIILNKEDTIPALEGRQAAALQAALAVYRGLGVDVLATSALTGAGVDALRARLQGRVNVLSGHSGVGKSSLLNAICPDWGLAVGAVNPLTSKGRQTTTGAVLLDLPAGGSVVDTPGFREFGLGHFEPAELGRHFADFRTVIGACRFADCLHDSEPGCALREAVSEGRVAPLRYQNYLLILRGLVDIK